MFIDLKVVIVQLPALRLRKESPHPQEKTTLGCEVLSACRGHPPAGQTHTYFSLASC